MKKPKLLFNRAKLLCFLFLIMFLTCITTSKAQSDVYLNKVAKVSGYGFGYAITIQGNYAYVTVNDGFVIIDIENSIKPKVVGEFLNRGDGFGIHIENDIVLLAAGGEGLKIVNVSDPSNPFQMGQCYIEGISNAVYTEDNYAFITSYETGLHIVDITNLSNPVEVGTYSVYGRADNVIVVDGIAFIAFPEYGVVVLNVTIPSSPAYISIIPSTGGAKGLDAFSNLLAVSCYSSNVIIVDISTINNPLVLGIYSDDDGGEAHGVEGNRTHLYIADNYGIEYLDISGLPSISKKAEYRTRITSAHDVEFKNNYVFIAGGSLGKTCLVFEVSDTKKLNLIGVYIGVPVAIIVITASYFMLKIRNKKKKI